MGRSNKSGIYRSDYETKREYNRDRMREYNRQKHFKTRLDRFYDLVLTIREFEKENDDDSFIALRLASGYKYKLVDDKNMKEEQ